LRNRTQRRNNGAQDGQTNTVLQRMAPKRSKVLPVGFVKDKVGDLVEVNLIGLEEIIEPSRGRNHDVGTHPQIPENRQRRDQGEIHGASPHQNKGNWELFERHDTTSAVRTKRVNQIHKKSIAQGVAHLSWPDLGAPP